MRHKAWLGLGGNLGDPVVAMAQALQALDQREDTVVIDVSPVYRTPPWGKTDQAWFSNATAVIETGLDPESLLTTCLDIEKQLKRERLERWGPRIIDIDVLAYEGVERLETSLLTIPHPRMTQRAFVMVPLSDIAPDLVIDGKTVGTWAQECDRTGIEKARHEAGWWKQGEA